MCYVDVLNDANLSPQSEIVDENCTMSHSENSLVLTLNRVTEHIYISLPIQYFETWPASVNYTGAWRLANHKRHNLHKVL